MATTRSTMMDKPKPTITFPQALMRERARYQISRSELARHVGVEADLIRKWERGEAIPAPRQFKRLATRVPRVLPYPPAWAVFGGAFVDGTAAEYTRDAAADLERDRAKLEALKPEPQEFHIGLARVREENGVTQEELAEVLGVTGQAVSQWECADFLPVKENLLKLFEVLPELKAGMETGAIKRPKWAQDIPKPVGRPGFMRAGTVDTMLEMALENSDEIASLPKPERVRHEAPGMVDGQDPKQDPAVLMNDRLGKYHEHEFKSLAEFGIPDRVVCAICGEPKPTSTVKLEKGGHSNGLRRCPCGGECEHQKHPVEGDNPLAGAYICKRCRKILTYSQTLSADDIGGEPAALAMAFVTARIKLKRAKEAEAAAIEAATNATTDRKNAEEEVRVAEGLLELAISEAK